MNGEALGKNVLCPRTPPDYLAITRKIVLKHVDSRVFRVFLFGSRAAGNARFGSDIDVGILGNQPLSSAIIAEIEFELDDSIVPFQVDIVDFSRIDPEFRKVAMRHIVQWN
jgi:type I restriction enzyme S subunit